MKGLEALKRIRPYADITIDAYLDIIERDLQALEFIKSVFDISMNGLLNTIRFKHEDTIVSYFCRNREEYEKLRKLL